MEIIYWIGVVCCVLCLYDLFTTKRITPMLIKVLIAIGILVCSWLGLVVYWFFLRGKLK